MERNFFLHFSILSMVIVLSGCSIAVDNVPDSKPDLVSESSQDSVTSSSEALSHLRRNPVPGSIEKFVNLHGVTKFNLTENDELVFSSSNSKSIFTPDYSQGRIISAVAFCEEEKGVFSFFIDGKYIGHGPCGKDVVTYTAPEIKGNKNPTISFTIENSTHFNVAFFQRKTQP